MNSKVVKIAITTALTSALVACGGGSDNTGSVSAEGIWGGTLSGGSLTALFVLENGETWGAYGNDSVDSPAAGVLQGQLSTAGNAVSGSLRDVSLLNLTPTSVSISGTTVPRSSLNLLLGGTTPLNMAYDASYDTPASLAAMAGTYTGLALSPNGIDEDSIVVVTSGGAISTISSTHLGCMGSGSVALRNSNKAVVNFSITFSSSDGMGGTQCLFANGTVVRGVAQVTNGELVVIGLDDSKTQGLLMTGDKNPS
jgi:hypothetical protein